MLVEIDHSTFLSWLNIATVLSIQWVSNGGSSVVGEDLRWKGRNGAPGEIRTPDLLLRRQPLYPAELRARTDIYSLHGWGSGINVDAAMDAVCPDDRYIRQRTPRIAGRCRPSSAVVATARRTQPGERRGTCFLGKIG